MRPATGRAPARIREDNTAAAVEKSAGHAGNRNFSQNGIDPEQKKIIITLSAQHFRAAFPGFAAAIIYGDGPGPGAPCPAAFVFKHIVRQVFR